MENDAQFQQGPSNLSMPEATVIPVLHYPDVPAAVAWLCRSFGFTERLRIATHRVQLNVGSGAVVVAQGGASSSGAEPLGTSIMVRVSDVDMHFENARQAGARILSEPVSQLYGERQYSVADLGGHVWTFSQTEINVDPSAWGGTLVSGGQNAA